MYCLCTVGLVPINGLINEFAKNTNPFIFDRFLYWGFKTVYLILFDDFLTN